MDLNINNLTTKEKLIAIEKIWNSLEKDSNIDDFTPNWHIDILDKLEEKERSNSLEFIDFFEVKEKIRKFIK